MSGTLYVVGTPIGNLQDFSPRGVETLKQVDFIAAEDTRVTMKLLSHFEIRKPMISYYEHNRREKGEQITARLLAGESCAIVTDAGMPAISDPGEDLVALCHEAGVRVAAVPGPTAFATALALSGLPVGRFTFEGFLSMNKKSRREHLEGVRLEKRTMVFYEAPHKLPHTLRDLADTLGDRRIAVIREITKIYEEVVRTTLFRAAEDYAARPVKGEFVLVIEGAPQQEKATQQDALELARQLMEQGASLNDAAKQAARETGRKKGDIYKELTHKEEPQC